MYIGSQTRTSFIYVAAVIIIVIAIIRLGMELFQFLRLSNTLEYIKDLVNWIEVALFVCSILFAFVFFSDCLCPLVWQWEVGVVAIFLAWIDLILFLRKIPLTGKSVARLVAVCVLPRSVAHRDIRPHVL